jgi:Initiator Replication protein
MPKTSKTHLKKVEQPIAVKATGSPWEINGAMSATVPLPNDVIITKIEGPYTERDRKLWAFLVAAVWDDLGIPKIYEIRAAKINAVFDELGGDTSSSWIWESAKRLSRTIVEWEGGEDGKRLMGVSSMMSAEITKELRATGILRFEISALLGRVIRNPCRFSRLRLHFMIGLSGKYTVTLYMLLESVANMDTPVLEVDMPQLRQWLKVPEGKLNRWVDIKRRAIEPALKQINENQEAAGFTVTMEEIKQGRAVDRVRFIVTKSKMRLSDEKILQLAPEKRTLFDPPTALPSEIRLPTSAYEEAKKVAPGWDVYELERQWRDWMKGQPAPKNPAGAFVNFCKGKPDNRRRV